LRKPATHRADEHISKNQSNKPQKPKKREIGEKWWSRVKPVELDLGEIGKEFATSWKKYRLAPRPGPEDLTAPEG
jgi:hypothetical protein